MKPSEAKMTVPITGNLTETQRFPAPLSGWGRMAGGPGRQTAPDIRQSKAAEAGYAEEGTCPPKGAASQDAFELPHLSQEPLDDREKNV